MCTGPLKIPHSQSDQKNVMKRMEERVVILSFDFLLFGYKIKKPRNLFLY